MLDKRFRSTAICGVLAVGLGTGVLTMASAAPAGDWPQFLGPQRNNVVAETVRSSWPETGPRVVWRRPGGEGFSGIAVVGDRVYTMLAEDRKEYLVCLAASDGRQLWRHATGGKYFEPQGGNGPRSTPSVDGDLVYAVGAAGVLVAVRKDTGQRVWSVSFQRQLGARRPSWGFSGSPLVEGDLLLVETGGSDNRSLTAFAKDTGQVVWAAEGGRMGYSSPATVDVHGVRQALFFTAEGLVSLVPDTGHELWRWPWATPNDVNAATPILVPPDGIFISSAYGMGAALLQLTRGADNALAVTATWTNEAMRNHMATSVVRDGHLYGFDNSLLKCLAADTGQERWKARGYGKGSLILADEMLVVLSDSGRLALVRARPDGHEELAGAQVLQGRCWTAPALAGGRLYLRDTRDIVCLDLAGG